MSKKIIINLENWFVMFQYKDIVNICTLKDTYTNFRVLWVATYEEA